MTEVELNKAIAELVYPEVPRITEAISSGFFVNVHHQGHIQCVDYCNNWDDLMPLVVEYGISLIRDVDGEFNRIAAVHGEDLDVIEGYDSPQLALAECLLLVLKAKGEE